jgi:cytochrome c oxidase assembly factor 5
MAQGDKTKQNDGHKSCKALALGLVKCLNESSCIKEEKRSYKECVFGKNLSAFSSECEDFRDKYLQCKHDQVVKLGIPQSHKPIYLFVKEFASYARLPDDPQTYMSCLSKSLASHALAPDPQTYVWACERVFASLGFFQPFSNSCIVCERGLHLLFSATKLFVKEFASHALPADTQTRVLFVKGFTSFVLRYKLFGKEFASLMFLQLILKLVYCL